MLPSRSNNHVRTTATLLGLALIAANAQFAHAQAADLFGPLTNFLNAFVDVLTNTWVRLIGVVAIIVTGLMWLSGRLEMRHLMAVVGGLILIFGAGAIVDGVSGSL